ncbi:hypothetical protein EDD18DRAFT_1139861 [Armillaria luteobubalina]|uniref:Uncharacterized protein n=1 Tax=Armillaria luteobubalina TaxID=153913 RepID=A0AA39QI21_9AGAR|nr:hypothetical protein EDD18DRAFT_1139861 [Armillaria luteobubalina]
MRIGSSFLIAGLSPRSLIASSIVNLVASSLRRFLIWSFGTRRVSCKKLLTSSISATAPLRLLISFEMYLSMPITNANKDGGGLTFAKSTAYPRR